MNTEKEIQTKIIADLIKIKIHLIPQFPVNNPDIINPNITYCVFETIIAILMDKYNIKDRDIREILIKEQSKNV